jgi:oligoendopeptidase F
MSIQSTWDLTPIYPGCESEEFLADRAAIHRLAAELEHYLTDSKCELAEAIGRYEAIVDLFVNLYAYASAVLSLDTSNEVALRAVSQADEASLAVERVAVSFMNFLATRQEEIEKRTGEGSDLAPYRYSLNELLQQQRHLMSSELEDLAADLARSGSDAFGRLQQAMGSAISSEFGDDGPKSLVELRNMASSADRELRRRAYETEIELCRRYEIPFAAALNGVTGTTLSLSERRKWSSPLERSLASSRIDTEILDALITSIEGNLVHFRRYLKAKASLLGVESLAFYDLFAPVGERARTYTYEEAHATIVTQFSAFSAEMASFADNAFKKGWIDAFPKAGKVGGAYDTSFPIARESRILANFDGSYGGVSTLAHELGHAWHDSVVLDKPALLKHYPMTLAETASIFSEQLVLQGALKEADEEERLTLVEHLLQDATQVCVDILSRFYFESAVFERRKEGDLSAAEFCSLMEDAQQRSYGDGLGVYHRYMWAVKGHYYSSDFSFYNYPYAFGLLFSLGLFAQAQKEGSAFFSRYTTILAATGSMSAREVASLASIDLADPLFWSEAMGILNTYIDEVVNAAQH